MGWIAFASVDPPEHEQPAKRETAQQTTDPTAPLPAFDVASVKENKSDEQRYSNFPLNPGPQYGCATVC
jgi:hypothetical protein